MFLLKKIDESKPLIFNFIKNLFLNYKSTFLDYSKKNNDIYKKYLNFITNGKCLRGSIVLIANEIFDGLTIKKEILLNLASFFEITHSSLLIHDDIMDNDKKRRNQDTINYFFYKKYKNNHLANSLAISLGDIGFFIGTNLINKISTNYKIKNQLLNFITSEYIKVSLAQNDDVLYSNTHINPNHHNIEKIYLFKTARYTFVLPIISVLILKNNNFYKNKDLIKILEYLGIIFQISDDLIGFLSDKTGKDLGSDIRENKKTIIRYYLMKELKNNQLKNLFGKKNLNNEELKKLRNFYQKSKTKKLVINLIEDYSKKILNLIKKNNLPEEFNNLIIDTLKYLKKRDK